MLATVCDITFITTKPHDYSGQTYSASKPKSITLFIYVLHKVIDNTTHALDVFIL
jgi:hypothetical protein